MYLFVFVLFVILMTFLNYYFSVGSINISFFDDKAENIEIQKFTEKLVQTESTTFLKYLFLDEQYLTDKVHKEYPIVAKIQISKNINFNLNISISKNEEFFYTCVGEDSGFLVKCMMGNVDGFFYQGIDFDTVENLKKSTTSKLINIEINKKVLYDAVTLEKVVTPDSLSGTRIYEKEDFKVLREILKWVQKNGFTIKKVYVDELNIVEIETDVYNIIVNLDKGYVDTVKDFETISKTGNLQKYINDLKEEIGYIDLSYKDKVFYKLKKDIKNDIMSTTSTTTVEQNAKEFLD